MPLRCHIVNMLVKGFVDALATPAAIHGAKMASMATRIHKNVRGHLYLDEWFEEKGVNDAKVANRLGLDRTTVWKWRSEQQRLDPQKIAQLAHALDIQPEQLWRPPATEKRPSLDALVKDAPDDLHSTVTDVVRRLVGRSS